MKSWLQDNNIKMNSTHNEGKSVVAERIIRTFKTKIYKHMTLILKNVFIHKLDEIVNKYSNKHYRTIKMRPVKYIDIGATYWCYWAKFQGGYYIITSKYKTFL